MTTQNGTMLGHALFSRIKAENLDALIVHRGVKGWYADVLLKDMPAGLPTVFGTPSNMPHPTRALAEEDGKAMLMITFRAIYEQENIARDKAPEDLRLFELHGVTYSLPGHVIDGIKSVFDAMDESYTGTPDSVSARLLERVAPFVDDNGKMDIEAMEDQPDEEKMKMLASMATLLCMGIFRLPQKTPDPIPDDNFPAMN